MSSSTELDQPEELEKPKQKVLEVSTPIKLGFVVLGLAFFFHLIGFACPFWHSHYWVSYGNRVRTYYGIWRWCQEEEKFRTLPYDFCFSMISGDYPRDYIRAAQFFETIGFLTALVSLILLLLAVCVTACRDRRILPILSAITAFGASGCIILGCIIFGAKDAEKDHLSWAFALALIGGILFAVAGIIVLIFSVIKKGVSSA